MACKKTREELGPNPNPEIWMDVHSKDGWYRKRRPKKKQKLNTVMQKHADALEVTMPAAKRLLEKLNPWMRGFEPGRIQAIIGQLFKETYLEHGRITFDNLKDLELQPEHTMKMLLISNPKTKVAEDISVSIMVSDMTIRLKGSAFTEYYFELITIWGDPMKERGLRIDHVESEHFPKKTEEAGYYTLRLDKPAVKQPWMALLKASCLEGIESAHHPRHYAMKVVAVGGGEMENAK
jgi:hypothetical protein